MKSIVLSSLSLAGLVLAAGAARADDVRVIVGFKGDASAALVSGHGGRVHRASARYVSASLPPAAVARLRAEPDVAYVEEDGVADVLGHEDADAAKGKPGGGGGSTTPPPQTTPWGISKVNALTAWDDGYRGAGVKVAVIDTGCDLDHPDLAANLKPGVDYVQDDGIPNDDNGHGSHVAGTIAAEDNTIGVVGVAPLASVYPVKVLDRRGSGWLSDVAAGIDWAADQGMNIANMSLGASSSASTLQTACDDARDAGVLLVCAAGNSGDGNLNTQETSYPAAYGSCIAVGATNSSDGLASFSNTGSYLWVSAPGVSVYSTYKNATYTTLNGTSMASPHAAGVAALLWDAAATPKAADVKESLKTKAADPNGNGWDAGYGWGIVRW